MNLDRAMKPYPFRPLGDFDSRQQELRDEADDFEDELAAEMLRTGAIEIWP
jgi:hypothetical protein